MSWVDNYGLNNWVKLINGLVCIVSLISLFNYKEKWSPKYSNFTPVKRWRLSIVFFICSLIFAMYLNDVGIH